MLGYLISVTENLLLVSVLTGILLGYAWTHWDRRERIIVGVSIAVTWLIVIIMGYMKKNTALIDSGAWNLRFVAVYMVGLIVFLLCFLPFVKGPLGEQKTATVQAVSVGLLVLGATGYYAPEAMTYPTEIMLAVETVISTDFFYRIVGWLFGLVLMGLMAIAVFKVINALGTRAATASALAGVLFAGLVLLALALRALLTRRIIPQSRALFQIAIFASNNTLLFGCVMGAIAVVCTIVLISQSLRVKEPYSNPAEHRKIRAKWRNRRRWAAVAITCLVCALLNVTVVKAYDSKEIELSPSEEFELRDDGCYVPLTQVEDGHLHRFTYESPDGVGIRFIIIKKPNGTAYGIGLDACDICGETGYFERDGQVVCKLCDVVMNISTIGFKGGCNPIVIDYSIKDGYIIVPFDTLLEHEVIFTR